MEVRPGYKQTEVGVVPEDWKVHPLSEHFRIYAGGDVPKHSLSQTRSESHPHPIFANALQDSGLYGFTNERRAKGDSLTITARGYLGHAEYRSEDFFPIVRLLVLEPTGNLDARFTTFAVNDRVKFAFESTGVPQLTAPQVGKYSVAAPSLPEQRAIAAALSDIDALLTKLDQLIAKKRDLKQAAMQQLLTGQTRLPGFSREWEVKPLGHVIDALEAGVSVNSIDDKSYGSADDLRVLKTSAVVNGKFLPDECKTIALRDIHRANLNPRCGTIIISRMNTPDLVGECGYIDKDYPLLFVPDRLWMTRFRAGSDVDARWLSYLLSSVGYKRKIKAAATGTSGSMKNLSKEAVLSMLVRFPMGVEQTAIATLLSDMDAEIAAIEARRDKTRTLKQGMMQELLTGRIRLV